MPTNLLQRMMKPGDLDRLGHTYPPFLHVFLQVLGTARSMGRDYQASRLYSTDGEQKVLYAQGRTVLWKRDAKGDIVLSNGEPVRLWKVTNAGPGESSHCYGIGADAIYDRIPETPKLEPGYDARDYDVYVELAEALGLQSGRSYDDHVHVNWPGYVTGKDMKPLLAARARGGLPAVWAYLDAERATEKWRDENPLLHAELERLDAQVAPYLRTA